MTVPEDFLVTIHGVSIGKLVRANSCSLPVLLVQTDSGSGSGEPEGIANEVFIFDVLFLSYITLAAVVTAFDCLLGCSHDRIRYVKRKEFGVDSGKEKTVLHLSFGIGFST